ncbi:MAG: hypothetical protein AVDCRST_MAG73-801, partial [uncultured Thermomicrobiales bacterium]
GGQGQPAGPAVGPGAAVRGPRPGGRDRDHAPDARQGARAVGEAAVVGERRADRLRRLAGAGPGAVRRARNDGPGHRRDPEPPRLRRHQPAPRAGRRPRPAAAVARPLGHREPAPPGPGRPLRRGPLRGHRRQRAAAAGGAAQHHDRRPARPRPPRPRPRPPPPRPRRPRNPPAPRPPGRM